MTCIQHYDFIEVAGGRRMGGVEEFRPKQTIAHATASPTLVISNLAAKLAAGSHCAEELP
jgi:hypothetical protein